MYLVGTYTQLLGRCAPVQQVQTSYLAYLTAFILFTEQHKPVNMETGESEHKQPMAIFLAYHQGMIFLTRVFRPPRFKI